MPKKKKEKGNEVGKSEKDVPEGKKKRKFGKKIYIIIGVIIIVVVLIIGFWGVHGGESYPTVSDVLKDVNKYLNKDVEVKGKVKKDSIDPMNRTFILTDGDKDLKINYTDILPSNFEEEKEVVIRGKLFQRTELILEAEEIIVGCPSKY